MNTINNLKRVWTSMAIYAVTLIVLVTGQDWIHYGYFDVNVFGSATLCATGTMAVAVVITYLSYHLFNAVRSDLDDFREWKAEKRAKAEAVMA